MSTATQIVAGQVVIAVDPHKASWTAAAVNGALQPLATLRVPANREGYRQLRRFAHRWTDVSWAVEGASGLGAPLTTRLADDGIDAPGRYAADEAPEPSRRHPWDRSERSVSARSVPAREATPSTLGEIHRAGAVAWPHPRGRGGIAGASP